MLGIGFASFLTLAIVSVVVAAAYHWALHPRFDRLDRAFGNLVVGWVGAWLGSPVIGHWLWKYENIYIVPALLGALAAIHVTVLAGEALVPIAAAKPAIVTEAPARAKGANAG